MSDIVAAPGSSVKLFTGHYTSSIERWFSVKILEPKYESAKDVYITVEYRQNGKDYDIISGGSGFHQILTLLAFLYGYQLTTILFDEPDAHLHVNLQREILDYFRRKSLERDIQFLIATHAEEFVRGVDASQIVSLLHQVPNALSPRRWCCGRCPMCQTRRLPYW